MRPVELPAFVPAYVLVECGWAALRRASCGAGANITRYGEGSKGCEVEQPSDEPAETEVRDLDARLPPPLPPADLGGGRIRPAALVRWGFFAGVGLLLAYGAAQAAERLRLRGVG